MRFNLKDVVLMDFPKSGPIMIEDRPLTIKNMLLMALLQGPPQQEAPGVKLEKYKLAHKIMSVDHLDVSAEEVALLKATVGVMVGPLIYGQICDFFDSPMQLSAVASGD